MYIYKVTNLINGKSYIGQTITSLRNRWNKHCSVNSGCPALGEAIKKYGKENFTVEEIGGANSLSELNYQEWLLIYKFNSLVPNGYNISVGGAKGFGGLKHSEETKQKMSNSAKGKKKSKEAKAKMRISNQHNSKKSIVRSDGVVFQCVKDAGEALNINPSNISKVLKGVRKHSRGYGFKYL